MRRSRWRSTEVGERRELQSRRRRNGSQEFLVWGWEVGVGARAVPWDEQRPRLRKVWLRAYRMGLPWTIRKSRTHQQSRRLVRVVWPVRRYEAECALHPPPLLPPHTRNPTHPPQDEKRKTNRSVLEFYSSGPGTKKSGLSPTLGPSTASTSPERAAANGNARAIKCAHEPPFRNELQ